MRRLGLIFLILCSLVGVASAQAGKPDGYINVTFGHVRGPNGSMISLKGLQLPYTIHKIRATRMTPGTVIKGTGAAAPPPANTNVYLSDAGSGYGFVDPGSSCLDDISTTSAGPGAPWETLTFGINVDANHPFLVRWIVYDTYTENAEPSAFTDTVADFGGIINGQAPGQYELTVNVAPAGVVMDSATFYVAQQFRSTQPDGNGPFDPTIGSVFNPTAPPQVGSSTNIFWYDIDNTGLYDDTMQDYFGDTSYANFLFGITVGGSQDTLVPFSYTLDHGAYIGGDVTSLWYTDQSYLQIRSTPKVSANSPVLSFEAEGLSSSANVTSLTLSLVSGSSSGPGTQTIELFNYTTNAWVVVDTEPLPTPDTSFNVTITATPAVYVNQTTRHVKARISYFKTFFASSFWIGKFDKLNWIVTHP